MRGFGRLLVDCVQNFFEYAVDISHRFMIPESEDEISHRLENSSPVLVFLCSNRVLAAIKLDDQLRIGAEKIYDEAINGDLPLELKTAEPAVAQAEP